jgi:hypothetical protein
MPNSLSELTKESRALSIRLAALPHLPIFASEVNQAGQAHGEA